MRALGNAEREQEVCKLAQNPANCEAGASFHRPTRRSYSGPEGARLRSRDEALRAIESRARELTSRAGDRLTALVERDRVGLDRRYLAAVADPADERALGMLLAGPQTGHPRYGPVARGLFR